MATLAGTAVDMQKEVLKYLHCNVGPVTKFLLEDHLVGYRGIICSEAELKEAIKFASQVLDRELPEGSLAETPLQCTSPQRLLAKHLREEKIKRLSRN